MNDKQKAQKIKNDLESRFNRAQFSVIVRGDDVTVNFIGGHDYADEYPTYEGAIEAMTEVIRKTAPLFSWTDYTPTKGKTIYR